MNETLWKEHAGVVGQRGVDLLQGTNKRCGRADYVARATVVLEDQSSNQGTLHNSEELIGSGVPVRCVQAARVDESNSGCQARRTKSGEIVDGGEHDTPACWWLDGVVDELKGIIGRVGRVWEQNRLTSGLALRKQKLITLIRELLRRESVHSVRVDCAVHERIDSIPTLVVFSRASFQALGLAGCHGRGERPGRKEEKN